MTINFELDLRIGKCHWRGSLHFYNT